LRSGARDLILKAVQTELSVMLDEHKDLRLPDGRQAVVRNGYLPERTVQTGIGDVSIKVPKIRDRSGEGARGLSAKTITRLKEEWINEHVEWSKRNLSTKRYVYFWVDGIYSNIRMDDRLCLLVIIGVTEHGHKELVAVEDGYRESTASWEELLIGLRGRGLTEDPKLAIAQGHAAESKRSFA
jgi:transposase-like protein